MCWHLLSQFPDRQKKTKLCHCQNCKQEYTFVLDEEKGRFVWQDPGVEKMALQDKGSVSFTPAPEPKPETAKFVTQTAPKP
jgi:hypothetical protein